MKTQNADFKIDYSLAWLCYPGGDYDLSAVTEIYHPAFLLTNENLRKSIPAFGLGGGDVLTVAASGDQPIYYAINGARRIDTFDQTFCARVVMDFKTAMVQNMEYMQYHKTMCDVYTTQCKLTPIMNVAGVPDMVNKMPSDTGEFLRRMSDCRIFYYGARDLDLYFTPDEFVRAKKTVHAPFNFIWSDIADLHTKLDTQYDVINISNILDWIDNVEQSIRVLKNLFQFLKPGGYILATTFYIDGGLLESFVGAHKCLQKRSRTECNYKLCNECITILRRMR